MTDLISGATAEEKQVVSLMEEICQTRNARAWVCEAYGAIVVVVDIAQRLSKPTVTLSVSIYQVTSPPRRHSGAWIFAQINEQERGIGLHKRGHLGAVSTIATGIDLHSFFGAKACCHASLISFTIFCCVLVNWCESLKPVRRPCTAPMERNARISLSSSRSIPCSTWSVAERWC